MARKRKSQSTLTKANSTVAALPAFPKVIFAWLGATGIMLAALSGTYNHIFGNISLEFVQALPKGYEFQLRNDTPSDRIVTALRVNAPGSQRMLFTLPKESAAKIESGEIPRFSLEEFSIEGYRGADGLLLRAGTSVKFRLPPVTSNDLMTPYAMLMDITLEISPTNRALSSLDSALKTLKIARTHNKTRYLVMDNHWTVTPSTSVNEAIETLCRESKHMHQTPVCKNAL